MINTIPLFPPIVLSKCRVPAGTSEGGQFASCDDGWADKDWAENNFGQFGLFKPEYRDTLRSKPEYKETMETAQYLVEGLGKERALEAWKTTDKYTATTYGRLNKSLRDGKVPKNTKQIDDYVEHAPKVQKDVVYRGVDATVWNTLKNGTTFTDKAFVSTTTDRDTAKYFSGRKKKGGILIIEGVKNKAARVPKSRESEFLLPRNSKFQVVSLKDDEATVRLIS